ncbi:hypothetical protein L195_g064511, partial [Trifolium pratense]
MGFSGGGGAVPVRQPPRRNLEIT